MLFPIVFGALMAIMMPVQGTPSPDESVKVATPKPPTFRIVAPSVICKTGIGDGDAADRPSQITISIQTPGGQQLRYRVSMLFEVLGGFRGQQHSLKLWDSVRRLEHRINGRDQALITQLNQINVNNTEIVGIDADGDVSEQQNYTVTFSDGKIKRTNPDGSIIPDDISFLLLGAPNTYADLEYVVEADADFCQPTYDYLIGWKVADLPDQRYTRIQGNVLRIPAGTLRAGHTYTVDAQLLRSNDSHVIVFQSIKVNVLRRGFEVRLIPDSTTIGVGSPLDLRLLFSDGDYSGVVPLLTWTCETATGEKCTNLEFSGAFEQTVEFASQGEYVVTVSITLGADTETFESRITVDRDVIVRPTLGYVHVRPVAAGDRLEIGMNIDHLVPHCYCEWTVAETNDTEYAYFNETDIPGGLGNLSVFDMEGNFLSELVDYENATMSRELHLIVPAATEDDGVDGVGWPGLAGDTAYRFRLRSTCPRPITGDLDEQPAERANVTSLTDLVVHTNAAPRGHPLAIAPLGGVALKTRFKFTTGVALDRATDYPLHYRFEFVVGVTHANGTGRSAVVIGVGEFYENTVTDTVLPLAAPGGPPIGTAYVVCDSRAACARQRGPNVTVLRAASAVTADKVRALSEEIAGHMRRMEYDVAFRVAQIVAISLRNGNEPQTGDFQRTMQTAIGEQIERLTAMLSDNGATDAYVSAAEIVNFVQQARNTLQLCGPPASGDNDDDGPLLQRLRQLFDRTEIAMRDHNRRRRRRAKRADGGQWAAASNSRRTGLVDRIHVRLDMDEAALLTSRGPELQQVQLNLTQRVHEYMQQLCRREPFAAKSFIKRSVRFEVRDIAGRHLAASDQAVPLSAVGDRAANGATVNFNQRLLAIQTHPDARYCVGKAWYASDFVGHTDAAEPREIFEVVVVVLASATPPAAAGSTAPQANTDAPGGASMLELVDAQDSNGIAATLPMYEADVEAGGQMHCQVWWQQRWQSEMCAPEPPVLGLLVHCACRRLGFIRLARDVDNSTEMGNVTAADQATATTTLMSMAEVADVPPTDGGHLVADRSTTQMPMMTTAGETKPTQAVVQEPPTTAFDQATGAPERIISNSSGKSSSTPSKTLPMTSALPDLQLIAEPDDGSGYAWAGGALLLGTAMIGALYSYHRWFKDRSQQPVATGQRLEAIVNELHEPVPAVRYTRFHDERGARLGSIETVFNGR